MATGDRLTGPLVPGLVALGLLLAGCGEQGADSSNDLEGRTFLTRTVTLHGQQHPLAEGSELRLTFEDGRLALNAGCNHLSGDYELDDGSLTVGPVGGTEMGCPAELMKQDQWLAELFAAPVQLAVEDDVLTLTSGRTVLTLVDRRTASPDVPLIGTSWTLTTLIDGDTAASVPEERPAGIMITDDGRVEVHTGCNSGGGSVEVDADAGTLTVGALRITRAGCADEVMAVERAVLDVLDGEVEYAVQERSLTLTRGSSGLALTADG